MGSAQQKLEKLEQYRVLSLIVAIGLLILSVLTGWEWLDWPRALAWAAAAVVTVLEARVLERLGRNARTTYLFALLYLLVAILCLV